MRKEIWKKMLACTLSACLLAGCGGAGKTSAGDSVTSRTAEDTSQADGSTSESGTASEGTQEATSGNGGASEKNNATSEEAGDAASAKKGAGKESSGDGAEETATPEPTPTSKPFTQKSRAKKGKEIYNDDMRMVQCLGLKEYKKLGKGEMLDKPADGKVFLVLFLEVYNMDTEEELYLHEAYLDAKVDGKSIEHTVLKNYPDGYGSIFGHIAADGNEQGFIVWEVPKDWKKLVVNFSEFGLLGGKNLKLTATRKDLADPKNSGIVG